MNKEGYIKEVFVSIQGEGKYAGVRQIFIRLSGCSIGCENCDTDYIGSDYFLLDNELFENPILPENLTEIIGKTFNLAGIHSIAITGGEPLEQSEFLYDLICELKKRGVKTMLETSGFYLDKLNNFFDIVDIFSIDIKIESSFGIKFSENLKKILRYVDTGSSYVKLIITENIQHYEFKSVVKLLKYADIDEIYLHTLDYPFYSKFLDSLVSMFYKNGITAFVIPQLHKVMEIK